MTTIIDSANPAARDEAIVGGKAANLARLADVPGVELPPWFAVRADAFRRHLAQNGLRDSIAAMLQELDPGRPGEVAEAGKAVRDKVTAAELLSEDAAALRGAYREAFGPDTFVSVRSSALGEDAVNRSFAGQLDSYLFVRGADGVADAVLRCFASGFSDRAITYRLVNGLDPADIAVAVVVQKMVDADVSGVLFTANPVTHDRDEFFVNATWGLGEGVVQGEFVTDTFRMARDGSAPVIEANSKDKMYRFDAGQGTGSEVVAVEADRADVPCLAEEQLRSLVAVGAAVEKAFGRPQDIEFAVQGEQLYILQARAITTLPPGPEDGNHQVWDNSNIIESYCGVTTPLTFSFIRNAYAIVYDQFLAIMGVSARVRQSNQRMFRSMLGLIRGCVYYNLRNWYALIRFFPGYRYNREFMENMMGVREEWSEKGAGDGKASFLVRYCVELPRVGLLVIRSVMSFLTVQWRMKRFLAGFEKTYARHRAMDLAALDAGELVAAYGELEDRVLMRWKPPILSDFFAMIFYGVLKKLIVAWDIDAGGSLQNDLMCGEEGVASAEPPKYLMRIAGLLRADETACRYVLDHTAEEIVQGWRDGVLPATVTGELGRYLDLYGDRSMNELKLEEPSLRESPEFLFTMLKNYVAAEEALSTADLHKKELETRSAAEMRVKKALGETRTRLLLKRRSLFRWVLRHARANVRNRENQRFARTRVFGLVRQIFLALGDRFVEEGVLRDSNDVFYLEVEEVFGFVNGAATCTALQELADLRRREFDSYRAEAPPAERFNTYGMVYSRNTFRAEGAAEDTDVPEGFLKGVPCCGGVVRGKAKKILSPQDDMTLNGEILVAEKTDPGWIPLYPSASAILIERGSVLSHSAIVAREMGKPTIVSIPGLVAAVENGQDLEMDGSTGLVNLRAGEEPPGGAEGGD